jgi:KAP family P-loop domain
MRQASGTDQPLLGVHFAGPETGWAVGDGGTILATCDGGKSWHPLENYRRHPAPWVYLAWICAFGCLLAAARKLPADLEQAPQSVADRLAFDRPLEAGDPDPPGYQRIAAGLSRFLRNEKTEPPLTVAVTGDWGSGKSSLMNLLRADLERYDFRPVWFNAWHPQKEEHLFAALLEAVRGQAVPGWWSYAAAAFCERGRARTSSGRSCS